jgi:7-cyano-7-deazaguanine synthase
MKVVVSLSGGMDSSTLLGELVGKGVEVLAVGFVYGSKHGVWERQAAVNVALHYKVPYRCVLLNSVMGGFKSALMHSGPDVPEGHYQAESMRQTVVPGRNLIFASVLAGIAESEGYSLVTLGVHAGDHFIYPDCRPTFVGALAETIHRSSDGKVGVDAPYLSLTKQDILQRGLAINVPYHLTRTCYTDKPKACGKCGSCQERLEAFANLNTEDPIAYESRELMPK